MKNVKIEKLQNLPPLYDEDGAMKCECGHWESKRIVVKQFGKTQCRDCARKNNRRLSNLVNQTLNPQTARKA